MTDLQKFFADADRIKKHERADNGGSYDAQRATEKIISLFISNNPDMSSLAASFADYWKKTYIDSSADMEGEPTAENLDKLGAMQSILDGETFLTECLSSQDWKELCSLSNFEAEDIPMDALEKMMMIFVDKQAF